MSLKVVISDLAEQDLINQYRWYYKQAGEVVAERFLVAFDASVTRLAMHSKLGRLRRFRSPELRGVRSFPMQRRFGVHLIFYREGEILSIERVMHGARNLPLRLLQKPESDEDFEG